MSVLRLRPAVALLCLPIVGCVIYRPATQNPAELATIEEMAFPVAASPALTGRAMITVPSQLQFGVNGIGGATRLLLPGAGLLKVDAGRRSLSILCTVKFSHVGQEFSSVSYSGAVRMICTLEPATEYVLYGRMIGPDISYGVEAWIEETATGTVMYPPTFIDMHQSIEMRE